MQTSFLFRLASAGCCDAPVCRRLRTGVSPAVSICALRSLCQFPETAHIGPSGLRRHRVLRPYPMVAAPDQDHFAAFIVEDRVHHVRLSRFSVLPSVLIFFWQASQEVEDLRANPTAKPLKDDPGQAQDDFRRSKIDTYIGMGFSNLVAFFIMLTTAVTLHIHGMTDIQSCDARHASAIRLD